MTDDINTKHAVDAQLYFAIIPEWVLDLPISAAAVRVYCCLRRYADNTTGECFPSRRTLAMRARISVPTADRCIKELQEHGALRVTKRKSAGGDWTSNLYTVIAVPHGVAKNLALPRTRIEATGRAKNDALTKAIINERQELRVYPLQEQIQPPTPVTKDGLLRTAQEMTELAASGNPLHRQNFLRIAAKLTKQAEEMQND